MHRGSVDLSTFGATHAAQRQDIADVEAYARRRHCPGRSSLVGQAEAAYGGLTARPKQSLCFWEDKLWFEPRRHGSEDGGGRNAIDRKDGEREKGGKGDGSQG